MITEAFLKVIINLIDAVLFWLPDITLNSIPVIGNGVEFTLLQMVKTWNAFVITFPYAETLQTGFMWIIVFEIGLLITKVLLGSRTPINT